MAAPARCSARRSPRWAWACRGAAERSSSPHPVGTSWSPTGLLWAGDDAMPKEPNKPPPEPKPEPEYDEELLETGQEEVFSRAEVELGVIEHASESGKKAPPG